MLLLLVNSLAAYSAWGIISSLIPVIRAGSRSWRMPAWLRALAITAIAWAMPAVPARYIHALACTAIVLFLMMIALKLGAVLPGPYTMSLPARKKHDSRTQDMRGYSPAQGAPGRRIPRMD